MKLYKSFDFKHCTRIIGNFVNEKYWLTDGHIAVNTTFFTPKLPTNCSGLAATHQVFSCDGKKFETENVVDIGRVLQGGPRYILARTDFQFCAPDCSPVAIMYGHDRAVIHQAAMVDVLKTCVIGFDHLNYLQNYDQPQGIIHVYHDKQDIEAEGPIAAFMPMRLGVEGSGKVEQFVAAMSDMYARANAKECAA